MGFCTQLYPACCKDYFLDWVYAAVAMDIFTLHWMINHFIKSPGKEIFVNSAAVCVRVTTSYMKLLKPMLKWKEEKLSGSLDNLTSLWRLNI
jgi:hypothetical protein